MNRSDFIKELTAELSYIAKAAEIRTIVEYYDEILLDLIEDGYSEEQAVKKLGKPADIAHEAMSHYEPEIKIKLKPTPLVIILLIIGFPIWGSLALAALAIILSFYIVIWCVPLTTGATGLGLLIGGIVSTCLSPILLTDGWTLVLVQWGLGFICIGIGILLMLLTRNLSKYFIVITLRFSKFIYNLFFGREGLNYEN